MSRVRATLILNNCPFLFLDPVLRFIEEQTAPTPAGEEPKSIKLAKTVAWGTYALHFIQLPTFVLISELTADSYRVNHMSCCGSLHH